MVARSEASLGLALDARIEGTRRLAAEPTGGWRMLARRDRASVGAAKKRWSAVPLDLDGREAWRNVSGRRSRQLLRTRGAHRGRPRFHRRPFEARHAPAPLGEITDAARPAQEGLKVLPPYDDRLRSIHPDAFGVLRRGATPRGPFFLEWERRAVRPSTMAERLAPYLRYYSTHRPTDDHGAQPIVLVVFHDELAATHFLRVAQEQMARSDVEVPLLVSHRGLLESEGPLGRAWLAPGGRWEAVHALQPASRERTRDGG